MTPNLQTPKHQASISRAYHIKTRNTLLLLLPRNLLTLIINIRPDIVQSLITPTMIICIQINNTSRINMTSKVALCISVWKTRATPRGTGSGEFDRSARAAVAVVQLEGPVVFGFWGGCVDWGCG